MGTSADDIKARAKIAAGAVTGNKELEKEGRTDRMVGQAKQQLDKAAGKAQELIDSAQSGATGLLDKGKKQAEALLDKAKGSKPKGTAPKA